MNKNSQRSALRLGALAASVSALACGAAFLLPARPASAHPHPEPQGFLSHPGEHSHAHSHGGMEKGYLLKDYRFSIGLPEGAAVTDPLTRCQVTFARLDPDGQPVVSVVGHDRTELYPEYEGFASVDYEIAGERFRVSNGGYDAETKTVLATWERLAPEDKAVPLEDEAGE